MKKKILITIAILLVLSLSTILSFSYLTKKGGLILNSSGVTKIFVPKDNSVLFNDRILKTENTVVDLTAASDLLNVKLFITVFTNPEPYIPDVTGFIADSKYSKQEKCIAIYSMAELDVNKYVEFANEGYHLFKNGKIEEDLLGQIIGTEEGILIYPCLVKNYENKKVRDLLTLIKNDKLLSGNLKQNIEYLLSGKWYDGIKSNPE